MTFSQSAFDETLEDNIPYDKAFFTKEKKRLQDFVMYYESVREGRGIE